MNKRYPLPGICLALIVGNVLQDFLRAPFWVLFPFTVLALMLMARFFRKTRIFVFCCLLFFVVFGAFYRCVFTRFPANHIYYIRHELMHRPVTLQGTVSSLPVHKSSLRGERTLFRLDVNRACADKMCWNASGRVRADLYRREDLLPGQTIAIEGKLHRPFSFGKNRRFSFRKYLARQGVYFVLSAAKNSRLEALDEGQGILTQAARLRRFLCQRLDQAFDPLESALLKAVLLGERSRVSQWLKDRFARTGTAHVLAISGLHVGVVTACLFLCLKILPLDRRVQLVLTITALAGYVVLTGARASVVRAGIMCSVFLFSFMLERENNSLNTLALAAIILLLMDPNNIFAIGFQLSFVCVLSILLSYPIFRDSLLKVITKPEWVRKYVVPSLSVSLSAWLGAAGLVAYYFHIIAPIGIIANLLIIPLITLVVALGLAFLPVGSWFGPLAVSLSACLKLLLNAMAALTALFAQVPGGCLSFSNVNVCIAVVYYCLASFGYVWISRRKASLDSRLTKQIPYAKVSEK